MPAHSARGYPRGRLSVRQGRGDHGFVGTAGQAVTAARFPRGHRPLRQHGLLSGTFRRQARDAGRPAGAQVVRHDSVAAKGGRRRSRSSSSFAQGKFQRADPLFARTRRPIARPGRQRSRPRRKRTTRAASRRSSATSGPRTPAATIFIATSSFATTATRREPSRAIHRRCRWAATIRATCGNGCRPMRTRPAATCWPSPITAICPTAACFR